MHPDSNSLGYWEFMGLLWVVPVVIVCVWPKRKRKVFLCHTPTQRFFNLVYWDDTQRVFLGLVRDMGKPILRNHDDWEEIELNL